ncbi:MAG: insulinase family protein [Caenispirillum bisanense]|nr:insulinase family protein [Caenispirillum bisanense]MCA1973678.1 insulinase family protein [Caenispirillum sp.]
MRIPTPFRAVLGGLGLLLAAAWPAQAVIDVQRVVSDQGIEAWLAEDHTLPIISLQFAFRGGAAQDPEDKQGLANMASGLLDEGAGALDSFAFQSKLQDLAIELGFDASLDTFSGSLKTITDNRETAFDLLETALTEPRFDPEPVERIRGQILAGLRFEKEDPNTIASRTWFETAFPDHPYRKRTEGTEETVRAITVEDLKQFAANRLNREDLVIGVAGDITPEELKTVLDDVFGGLPDQSGLPKVADVTPEFTGRTVAVEMDIPQTVGMFGHAGIARDDPDFYAAYVLNYILGGGGFASRLMEEVREERGLAYSVYSYLYPLDHAALMIGGVATQRARFETSMDVIREEWRKMAAAGPTEGELADAKTYLTGAFPLRFSSTGAIASILMAMQLDDLPIDHLETRNAQVEAVTLADVKRVAERLLKPENLLVVVVGKPAEAAEATEPAGAASN